MGTITREEVKNCLIKNQDRLSYEKIIEKTGYKFEELKEIYDEICREGNACLSEEAKARMSKSSKKFRHLGTNNTGLACIKYRPRRKGYSVTVQRKEYFKPTLYEALKIREQMRDEISKRDPDYKRDYSFSERDGVLIFDGSEYFAE